MKREPPPADTSPYGGDFDTVMNTIVSRLAEGPYLLGQTFSAADLLWGFAFSWTTTFGIVDRNETIDRYVRRITRRRAYTEAMEADEVLAAEHDKAAAS